MADVKITADISDLTKLIGTVNQTKTSVEVLGRSFARSNDTSAYMRGINQIVEAQRRLAPNLRTSRSEIMKMGAAARQQAVYLQELNRVSSSVGLGVNRMGVLTQQAGYQIGDFIVQVQSGTNAFVAFGQQATQVAGTLTLLGGKWIAIGSALGVTIPLLTAAGAMWMRTRQQAREAASGVTDFQQSIESLDESLRSWLHTMEAARQGISPDILFGRQGVEQAERDLEVAQAALELLTSQSQAVGLLGQAPMVSRSDLEELDAAIQAVADAEERLANLRAREAQEQRQRFEDSRVAYEEEIELLQEIAQHGEDSAQVLRLRSEQTLAAEIRRIEAMERAGDISEAQAVRLALMAIEAAALTQEAELQALALRQAADEYERLEEAASTVASADLTSWNAQVAMMAQLTGLAANEAERYLRALQPLAGMTTGDFFTGEGGLLPPSVGTDKVNVGNTGHRPSGGGGGAGGQSLSEIISQMEQEANQRLELIQLSERQSRVREIELELIREIGGEADATAMAQIQAAAQTIEALESQAEVLENLRDIQEGFADTVGESVGDALMSIIDGTKSTEDAFKSMAAAIIRELYDILVVQQIVGSIRDSVSGSGFLSNFFGSMAGKASGGTMNPNQPYLVGERGPEIVMPGRQSTVANANQTKQAMSQESAPVINMTYNFQGGITEADLARATPMLVERTKAAVVDTVQRGGSMARVFR